MSSTEYINVEMIGGAILRLTTEEYTAALRRAKGWIRAVQQTKREAEQAIEREAHRLEWIEEQGK